MICLWLAGLTIAVVVATAWSDWLDGGTSRMTLRKDWVYLWP